MSNQIKQLIRNGRSASLQRTFKKSFTSFSHSTRNKTRDGLIRVRNIRALNGRFNTSITHAYSIVIGSKSAIQGSNVPNPDEEIGRAVQQECRDRTRMPYTPISTLFPYTTLFRSLQRTFKKSFTSFSHSTRNKTRDGLIRVRNIRALNGRFNTSITHAYSIVIGSKSAIQGSNVPNPDE